MTTNNHPAHGPVSLDRLHQISEILSKEAAQSDGGNLGCAIADAVKVIDGAIAAFGVEPVAWQWEYRDKRHVTNDQRRAKIVAEDGEVLVQPLYTAPPVPEPMKAHQIRELVNDLRDIAIEYQGTQQLRERIARTVRSAMLQEGNSPAVPDTWIPVSERMPEDEQEVIVNNKLGYRYVSYFDEHSGLFFDMKGGNQVNCIEHILVTHWMPSPSEPQKK